MADLESLAGFSTASLPDLDRDGSREDEKLDARSVPFDDAYPYDVVLSCDYCGIKSNERDRVKLDRYVVWAVFRQGKVVGNGCLYCVNFKIRRWRGWKKDDILTKLRTEQDFKANWDKKMSLYLDNYRTGKHRVFVDLLERAQPKQRVESESRGLKNQSGGVMIQALFPWLLVLALMIPGTPTGWLVGW
jgi:hypothetical protein